VTNSILGPAPIVDFDGTLACLPVAWDELRAQLGVDRIGRLWQSENADAWAIVRDTEVEAARRATPIEPVRARLEEASTFAVLTSNSEVAVAHFLQRFASLESRLAVVVGRETLAGPKRDYEVFRRGFSRCVDATASVRAGGTAVYAGDRAWELDFARQLGAEAVDVGQLSADS
jgi:phosphoglycolate phosphatase-like HAD superfamily hydrolase